MMGRKRRSLLVLALATAGWALLAAQSTGFRFDGPISRVISPNKDGLNDIGILCFDNASDSEVTGKIFTLRGSEVAALQRTSAPLPSACPTGSKSQHMDWDPLTQGNARGGIYVYQVKADGFSYTGTFLVVR